MKRRKFLKHSLYQSAIVAAGTPIILNACGQPKKDESTSEVSNEEATSAIASSTLNISLAQWSIHRAIEAGELSPADFAAIARSYDIDAVEYVAGFYMDEAENETYWNQLKSRAENEGVSNLLIMVDNQGDLGSLDDNERNAAVEMHHKWVNAANLLGCHSIRVNAFGDGDKEAVKAALVDGMGSLCEYAAQQNINVLIENHGLYSSDGKFVVSLMEEVNMDNFGTLPDFGNWCMAVKWGGTNGPCDDVYDHYQGVSDFLPYAKGVSAKSYDFTENGDATVIDYYKMMKIVKDFGFDGYIGIEYEGSELSEADGIRATKTLIEKAWNEV